MATELTICQKDAQNAIRDEVNKLLKSNKLEFKGLLSKMVGNREFKFHKVESINVEIGKQELKLNKSFFFEGEAIVTFSSIEDGDQECMTDGKPFPISGEAILKIEKDKLIASIEKNEINISDNK